MNKLKINKLNINKLNIIKLNITKLNINILYSNKSNTDNINKNKLNTNKTNITKLKNNHLIQQIPQQITYIYYINIILIIHPKNTQFYFIHNNINNTILNNSKNSLHFFQEFKHTHITNPHQYKQNQLILNTILHSCNCNKIFLKKELLPSQKQLKRKVKVRKIKIIRRKKQTYLK
jgi:hypothetical protein